MFRSGIASTFAFVLLALASTLVFTTAAHGQPRYFTMTPNQEHVVEDDEGVDDWNSDVLNLTVNDPGVILLEGRGADMTGTDGDENACGGTRVVGPGWLPLTRGRRAVTVRPGTYEIQIAPHANANARVQHRLSFVLQSYCAGGDDHGSGDLCSTELCSGVARSGDLEAAGDIDSFTFYLASAATVTFESTGSTDVEAELFDEDGARLASDDDSGSGDNFQIVQMLPAGRYFIRVSGFNDATGAYSVSVN